MTSFVMEWNMKSPLQWEWENQGLFSGRESGICISRPVQRTEWSERGGVTIGNASVYSVPGCALSGSELGNGSSRSSISASIDSSSKGGGVRTSGINFDAVEGFHKGLDKNNELARVEDTGTSPVVASLVGLGEPLICLKLGKRTYFEDVCAGSNIKTSSLTSAAPAAASVKKTRVSHQSTPNSRCRVEGCNVDLSGAKDYHRKHRVCEGHSKCSKVVVDGHERRFCQQCSRFHDLSEFDQKKRSCRRRLSDHNARRRKPQTDTISFTSSRLSSSFYDDRQQMNYLLSRAPFGLMRSMGSSTWEDSGGFSITDAKGPWIKSTKTGGMDGQLQFFSSDLGNSVQTLSHDLDKLLPLKGTTAEVLNQGMEASAPASNLDGAPDLRRALSLLSTDSWGSVNSGQSNLAHFANTGDNVAAHPAMQTTNSTSGYLLDQQAMPQQERMLPFNIYNNGSQYQQEFQLSRTPYGTSFFNSSEMISKPDGHFLDFKA